MDTEKLTINLTPVDLGKIDVLVENGLYSTRADLIRTAVRRLIDENEDVVKHSVSSRRLTIGAESISSADLERAREAGERLRLRVVGLLRIAPDVTPALADEVIEHLTVRGVLRAPEPVVAALGDRLDRGSRRREG